MNKRSFRIVISICLIIITVCCISNSFFGEKLSTFDFKNVIITSLSGLIGALISAFIVSYQIRKNSVSLKIQNQLKLREFFSTEERMKIHRIIKEKMLEPYGEGKIYKTFSEFKIYLDDYLGLFEIAYKMLKDGDLDKDMFFQSYSYRISLISDYPMIKNMLEDPNKKLWELLKQIVNENNKWKSKHKILY